MPIGCGQECGLQCVVCLVSSVLSTEPNAHNNTLFFKLVGVLLFVVGVYKIIRLFAALRNTSKIVADNSQQRHKQQHATTRMNGLRPSNGVVVPAADDPQEEQEQKTPASSRSPSPSPPPTPPSGNDPLPPSAPSSQPVSPRFVPLHIRRRTAGPSSVLFNLE